MRRHGGDGAYPEAPQQGIGERVEQDIAYLDNGDIRLLGAQGPVKGLLGETAGNMFYVFRVEEDGGDERGAPLYLYVDGGGRLPCLSS